MTIACVSASQNATQPYVSDSAATITVPAPSGLVTGNTLLCFLYLIPTASIPDQSGWTTVAVWDATGSDPASVIVLQRAVSASEPTSYTFTSDTISGSGTYAMGAIIGQFSGVLGLGAYAVNYGATAPSVTADNPGDTWLTFFAAPTAPPGSWTPPSGASLLESGGFAGSPYDLSIVLFGEGDMPAGGTGTATTNIGSVSQNASVSLLAQTATAPYAPTLTAPGNGAYVDTAGAGVTLAGTYNSADTYACNAYCARIKTTGGSYSYWNAATAALQSTAVWNACAVAASGTITVPVPAGVLADGSTYNWSIAAQESADNLQGPFASDFTFAAQTPPTLTVTGPAGASGTSMPTTTWTATPTSGLTLTGWQVIWESGAYGTTPGSGTQAATLSGSGNPQQATCPATLANGVTYRCFVQITETGGETSAWTYTTFTVSLDPPATPIVTASQGVGPNGLPVAALTVQGTDNLLTEVDASFETSVGTWTGTANVTVAQSAAEALDGSYSLAVTATAAGNAAAGTGDYTVAAGQTYSATAAVRAATTGRQVTLAVLWLNSSGTLISTTTGTPVTDTTTGWAVATASAAAPAGAVHAQLQVTIASAAASEVHYVDEAGIRPGTDPSWYRGGLVGTVQIVVTRDDGLEVRGASTANPAIMPAGQVLSLMDAEMVPTVGHTWTAVGTAILSSTVSLSSGTSAASNQIALVTGGWWQFDPTDLTTAVSAQMTDYNPQITEQSTAHIVLGQTNPNMVASAMGGVDGAATFETFDVATYQGLSALLRSQKTVFISDPFGDNAGVTYVRFGPQTGGMSTGTGNKSKDAKLHPSTASAPHHEVSVTWIAQNRPAV